MEDIFFRESIGNNPVLLVLSIQQSFEIIWSAIVTTGCSLKLFPDQFINDYEKICTNLYYITEYITDR